ncbi:RagB/SusD family nutrient uptake outer membrane protein [uncultured Bacteroides sp.]|uniref:RagB/SusD family nutrient uptake outer membrane protein n=1 Tax=uncultured Bacteroides sp. TaxID=162156 RepID=UPI00262CCE48|nr:RagB/SusD family nutrient uptake outer membrane protein [uncultured Bacteroides sp.]
MKKNIKTGISAIVASLLIGVSSCNYLEVVPIEQPDLDDMMVDSRSTLEYLYSCYGYMQNVANISPLRYNGIEGGADEFVVPQTLNEMSSAAQYNNITPVNAYSLKDHYPWRGLYESIGYCNQFLNSIKTNCPEEVTPQERLQYIAEATYLKAYYHFRLMQLFGPIPIMDTFLPSDTPKGDFPGRSHFDYCVNYVIDLCDEALSGLPPSYTAAYYGRATTSACKMLKARVLLLAASPMYNGEFPAKGWKNTNFETPGYGNELVSYTYDSSKWQTALDACLDAIETAEGAGHKLFDMDAIDAIIANYDLPLPLIPGSVSDEFKKRVLMLRFQMIAQPDEGNREAIWSMVKANWDMSQASIPHFFMKTNDGITNLGQWSILSPTIYTITHFFTANGVIPEEDNAFPSEDQWYEVATGNTNNVINLCVGREPRFYANLSFNGDQYSSVIANGKETILDFTNPQGAGYNTTLFGNNNNNVTGFLNKKWVHPNIRYTGVGWGSNMGNMNNYATPLMRLGELYLMAAECYAHIDGGTTKGLEYLNKIRKRAGIPEWTETKLGAAGKTLLDAVLEERFVELYYEGQRFHDIRRYCKGREYLSKHCYQGLDAYRYAPTLEQLNTVVQIDQPFDWDDRLYLMPIPDSELYSNPQLVQAPGY